MNYKFELKILRGPEHLHRLFKWVSSSILVAVASMLKYKYIGNVHCLHRAFDTTMLRVR